MGIEIKHRSYDLSLTAVGGGIVGGAIAERWAHGAIHSTGLAAATDAAGASLGGRLKRIPSFIGGVLGSSVARKQGVGDTGAALSAHFASKATRAMPAAEQALDGLAETGEHAITRGAAKVGETILHETPGTVGAIAGAKLTGAFMRPAVYVGSIVGGALLAGSVAAAVLPSVTWSND